jgi:hypothetical protein
VSSIVAESEGSQTEGATIWFVIVFGVIASITMIILGAIMPDRVGPWWIYGTALAGFIALGWWLMGRSSVKIQLVEADGRLRVVVRGKSVDIDAPLAEAYERWHWIQQVGAKYGGPMAHFNLTVRTADGRFLGFRQMGGPDGAGWPRREDGLPDGPDVFLCLNIFGLERAVAARAKGSSGT